MVFVQFTQPDDQAIVINADRRTARYSHHLHQRRSSRREGTHRRRNAAVEH